MLQINSCEIRHTNWRVSWDFQDRDSVTLENSHLDLKLDGWFLCEVILGFNSLSLKFLL